MEALGIDYEPLLFKFLPGCIQYFTFCFCEYSHGLEN